MQKFANLLQQDADLHVPVPISKLSTARVLVSKWVPDGIPIGQLVDADQHTRDRVGGALFRLCMRELFEWRMMQTDPNWTNFLYTRGGEGDGKIHLIDFGATQEYAQDFVRTYYCLLKAAAEQESETCVRLSTELGFLTGLESTVCLMLGSNQCCVGYA